MGFPAEEKSEPMKFKGISLTDADCMMEYCEYVNSQRLKKRTIITTENLEHMF